MAFTLPNNAFRLTAAEMGTPDLASSLAKGIELGFLPRQKQTELELKKAESRSKNAYANLMLPQMILKVLGNKEAFESLPVDTQNQLQGLARSLADYQMNNSQVSTSPKRSNLSQNIEDYTLTSNGSADSGYAYDARGRNVVMPAEQVQEIVDKQSPAYTPPANTPAERTARYEQTVAQGSELGKKRAEQITSLEDIVESERTKQNTLNELTDIVAGPVFQSIRTTPDLQQHELAYFKNHGTPEQQAEVGRFRTLSGNIIKDSSRDFAGQFRKGEQGLLQSMKPSDADTIDSAKGKLQELSYLSKFLEQRSKIASDLMLKRGMSKIDALDRADEMMNGNDIRKKITDRLYPPKSDDLIKKAADQGYTVKMIRIDPVTKRRQTAMVHGEDVEDAKQQGWKNA